nr:RNA-directed DNA polymerase, eukaryota, reverse transcriptase zinc-binding domain protein [Tanacetum cinerariifolium]
MFYGDDEVFVGQWCDGNINTLVHVLECFFQASCLRINMCKSKIMGVNVGDEKVKSVASKLGYLILNTPFSYLGTKVGGNMSQVQAWTEVVDKASWVKWKSVLASKEKGGLEVSSLYALNRALMMKWVWRFYSQKESLWARVIKDIYGDNGQVEKVSKAGSRSCWRNIVNEVRILSNQGIKVLDYMQIKLGNGESMAFWDDNWIGGKVLKYSFPRVYALETEKKVTVNSKMSDTRTLWIKYVPIKVNVLAWKIKIEALPTRFNISRIGIDIDSILCPICECGVESARHVFFSCSLVRQIVRKVCFWWDVMYIDVNSYVEWFNRMNSLRLKSKSKLMIEDTMAEENVPAPAPTKSDDLILTFFAWLSIGKGNLLLDLQKLQKNHIFRISVDILQNTNFFKAFIASANVSTIYWFTLNVDLLCEALEITHVDANHPFVSPPAGEAVMDFVNELGYPEPIYFVSKIHVNNLYQPWRAILSLINQCLTDKRSSIDKPRHHVLQMLWGIVTRTNVDYVELLLEMAARKPTAKESVKRKIVPPADKSKKPAPAKQAKPVKEKTTKPSPVKKANKGKVKKVRKGKSHLKFVNEEQDVHHKPEPQGEREKYDIERAIQTSLESFQANGQAPVSGVAIREPWAGTKILNVGEEQGEDVSNMVVLEEKTVELDTLEKVVTLTGPNLEPMHDDFIATVYPKVHESLKHATEEHVHLENPLSSLGTLLSMKNLDNFTFGDQDLPKADMKEILHQRMFESGSYKSHPEHVALYEALKASMERENRDALLAEKDKSPWKTFEKREASSSSSMQKSVSQSKQPIEDVSIPKVVNDSDSEDTSDSHILKIKTRLDWLKLVQKEDKLETPEPDWAIPPNDLPEPKNNWVDLVNPEGNRVVPNVRKPLPPGGPHGQIVLRMADYQEYKISEADFKNMHQNDFEDLYLLHLQGKLNHLSGADKVNLFNADNLWIRNIVVKKCVEDLHLGVKSY